MRIAVVALLLLAACRAGEPAVIDGSSPEAFEASMADVRSGLAASERMKFEAAVKLVQASAFAKADTREAMQARIRRKLDGRTAAEVIADYERKKADATDAAIDQVFDLKRKITEGAEAIGGDQTP